MISLSISIPLWYQGNEVVHLCLLECPDFFFSWRGREFLLCVFFFLLWWRRSTLQQVGRKFYHGNTSECVSQKDDGILWVEGQVGQLGVLHWLLLGQSFVLFSMNIIDIDLFQSCTGENSRWVRGPHGINNNHSHIKDHDLSLRVSWVPNSDSPVSRCRDESGRMVVVPLDFVNCQQMTLVSLLILPRVSQRALMDFSFFSTHKEGEVIESVEVKAKTTCKSNERSFFFFLSSQL